MSGGWSPHEWGARSGMGLEGRWQGLGPTCIPESMATHAAGDPVMAPVSPCPQVDLAVVEVGIGGAYDCTNIIR